MREWISVKDKMPQPFKTVLVHMPGETPCETVREGFIDRDGSWYAALYRRDQGEVTHWMPLPEPPKEE